ncbi:MAG: 16S rRNA (guanine(527)-N(7))-methyltransferase RsmG [Nitrospirae bacterium]|nr:16S rRNA (guanine(527)-N(7))-methyltransferase RsmG [Nitrospirota bacterium]
MKPEALLKKGLKELGISCSETQTNSFMTYLSELRKWNSAYNLTALKTDEDIIVKHFLDSLLYLKALPEGNLKLADAGSGAGFPGIPIKIVRPEIDITLIESSRKKCSFLRHMIRSLNLTQINVLEQRLENLGDEYKSAFDVIVSRAAFSMKEFLNAACAYVKKGGILVLSKGPKMTEELKELSSEDAVKDILKVALPVANVERNLVVLECKKQAVRQMT